jgi:hypothetical protein
MEGEEDGFERGLMIIVHLDLDSCFGDMICLRLLEGQRSGGL